MDRVAAGLRMAKERQAADPEQTPPARDPSTDVWTELSRFDPDPATMARNRIVTFGRTDPACASFDMIRTKLLYWMRQNGWTSVGITSPTSGCGKTTMSANLAFSLAQLQLRVLLVDLDMRRPALARQIGLPGSRSMAEVLQGKGGLADNFVRCGENLAIGSTSAPVRNSADMLLSGMATQGVAKLKSVFAPDIIVYDLPPMLVSDDVLAFMPHLDCMLLTVAAEVSRLDEIWACQGELAEHGASFGIVVNKCWYQEGGGDYGSGTITRLRQGDR